MKVLFATGGGHLPEMTGGVQSSIDDLANYGRAKGYEAGVLSALFGKGFLGFIARVKLKLFGRGAAVDHLLGYPTYRAWFAKDGVDFAARNFEPDVALVQGFEMVPLAKAFAARNVPVVMYFRDVEYDDLGGDLRELDSALYIANSKFTAACYKARYGVDSVVIPPQIDQENYCVEREGELITFINVYPEKGFDLACQIAERCPDLEFLFLESWPLSDEMRRDVEVRLAPLKNVRLHSRTSDMKAIYRQTKILLAPSKWEEAWGRVASEAHCSGIPVVGSSRGGLPEAIGPGGVVLDYEAPLEDWVGAVRSLAEDSERYEALSKAALEFSRRPDANFDIQFDRLVDVLKTAIGKAKTGSRA